jgi:hypothetical protein
MEGDFQSLDESFEDVFENEIYARERFRFPLLELPPELLIRICELAVARRTTIDATLAPKAKNQAEILQQPAITRACRLLRRESLRAFYRDNEFEAFHWERHACIREWLITIGPDNLRAMQTLTFHCKFNTEFWEKKFDEIGIKTKCEVAQDQSKAIGSLRTLKVTFL